MKSPLPAILIACVFCFQANAQTTYLWNPQGGSTSAKVVSNWKIATCNGSTATVFPGSTDTLVFSNCSAGNATIDTNITVRFVNVKSSYSGTVILSGSNTFTTEKMRVTGGTFSGGSGTINVSSSLSIDGGIFSSTSGTFTLAGNFTKSSGTFNHNNGTVVFKKASSGQPTIAGSSITAAVDFYDVIFDAPDATTLFNINSIYFTVNHSLTISGDEQLFINGDTILMAGSSNLTLSNTSGTGGGTADIKFNSSNTQTITGSTGTDYTKLPNIIIAKSGTLNLSGNIGMGGTTYLDYRTGTISEGSSSFLFYHDNTIKGKMEFYDVEFQGHSSDYYLTDTIVIGHDLLMTGTAVNTVNNGAIKLNQDLTYTNSHSSSIFNSSILFSNLSQDQSIAGSFTARVYDIEIKGGKTLILQNPMIISHALKLTSGFIKSTSTNLLTLSAACTVSGGSSSSFIKGPVKKVGNTAFTFPLGGESSFKPLSISASGSVSDAFIAEHFSAIQPMGLTRSGLTYTSMCEYWNLSRTAGSSNVTVALSWDSYSCDVYTLSTLKIGRWNGTAWEDVGSVATTGNTTTGTIITSSAQSSFGNFLIAKNSPAVIANAGSDATISLGSSTTLGGSPAASGGTSPYTYRWAPIYGLSSPTVSNPTASPFATKQYFLKVTDTDQMVDVDTITVTVNGFSLNTLIGFPLLAGGAITVAAPVSVIGAVGSDDDVDDDITASESIYISTSEVTTALTDLDEIMDAIDGLTASTISGTLGGNTYTSGIYRISGNSTLSGTLTLDGDESSYFVIDIGGNLTIANGAEIVLDGISRHQVYFRVGGDISIPSGSATLNGYFFGSEDFIGTVVDGDLSVQVLGIINGGFTLMKNLVFATLNESPRSIDHFIGYNGTNTTKAEYGWDTPGGFAEKMPALSPSLLRYPGGTVSNWWNWQTGWWRGYNNPLYNNYLSYSVKDELPLPEYADDGLPWDNNASQPLEDKLEDFKVTLDACAAFPILNLNLLTSDLGTQLGLLFKAHCADIPIKYIELGNEFYLNGDESADAFPQPVDYAATAQQWASAIKQYFPDVKIAAVAASSKTNISNPPSRRNYWNIDGIDPTSQTAGLFSGDGMTQVDALTFHIYPWTGLKEKVDIYPYEDLDSYSSSQSLGNDGIYSNILAEPFRLEADLESWNFDAQLDPQPEFSIFTDYPGSPQEIWLTEFNQEEDYYNFRGRWLHSLFDAGLTLAFLSNPNIAHITCQTMFSAVDQGAYFSTNDAYPTETGYPSSTTQWAMAATGYGLKYLAEAMKHTTFATQLNIFGSPFIKDVDGTQHQAIVGWMFSDSEDFNLDDSLIAVVVNFSEADLISSIPSLFPLGGRYKQMTPPTAATIADRAKTFLTGATNEVTESSYPVDFSPNSHIILPAYSITLLKGTWDNMPIAVNSHVNIEASKLSVCSGEEVTLYVSGADKYLIYPPVNGQTEFEGPMIKMKPTTTTLYQIAGVVNNPAYSTAITEEITITVSNSPVFSASLASCSHCTCPGDERVIELESATANLLYNWMPRNDNDFITQINSNEFHIAVHPQATTTYTITATNGTCYCSEQSIEVAVVEPVDAGPDVWVCSDFTRDGEVFVGYIPVNTGDQDYQWSYSEGTLDDDEESYTFFSSLPDVTTIYTLTDEGECESSDEVTVHILDCCDRAEAVVFDPFDSDYTQGNYLTATDFATAICSCVDQMGTPTTLDDVAVVDYGNEIVINGPFYINMNLTLKDCDEIYFGPEAEIIIEPNCQLTLNRKTRLQAGCDQMWNGIRIEGNLREDDGIVIITNNANKPLIKDAVTGINATKDSRLKITTGDFQNNHEHISISNYRFSLEHQINNATFTSVEANMLSPFENTQTAVAIKLNDVPSTADGTGLAKIKNNTISYADFALHATWTGVVVESNTIDHVGTGIYSLDAQGKQDIIGNLIESCNNGITIYEMNGEKTTIADNQISTNELVDNPAGIGIYISDIGTVNKLMIGGELSGNGNTIISNAKSGILLQGFGAGTVQHNTVNLFSGSSGNTLIYGIRGEGLPSLFPDNTSFYSNIIDVQSGGTPSLGNKRGISLSTTFYCDLKCNTLDNTEFGMQFQFVNDLGTKIQGNDFNSYMEGLVLGEIDIEEDSSIPDQGSNSLTPGNNFLQVDPSHDLLTINNSDLGIKYLINNDPYPPAITGPDGFEITIDPTVSNPPYFGMNDECLSYFTELEEETELFLSIVSNEYPVAPEDENLYLFILKSVLFERLQNDPELRGYDDDLETFYDTASENNIGKFSLVKGFIKQANDTSYSTADQQRWVDSAIIINSSISPNFNFEYSQKAANDVYLNTIAKHTYGFTVAQWDTIVELAFLCPYINGTAVFQARALFRLNIDTVDFDDRVLCGSSPKLEDANPILLDFELFPNPTSSILTILASHSLDENLKVVISDLSGKQLFSDWLLKDEAQLVLSTFSLPSGIYFCSVTNSERVIWIDKFIKAQ